MIRNMRGTTLSVSARDGAARQVSAEFRQLASAASRAACAGSHPAEAFLTGDANGHATSFQADSVGLLFRYDRGPAMPELEYVVLAEYVRQDAGMTHIMSAGMDTIAIPPDRLPAAIPVGLAARITFDASDQVGAEHEIGLIFHGPGGAELLRMGQTFQTPPPQEGVPAHWRTAATLVVRLLLPIPAYGNDYRLEVVLDDDPRLSRSVDVRAVAPA